MNVADYAPFAGSIGGGFAAGALVGFAIKQVLKIAAVIVGLFIAAMAYLQYQGVIHVDWVKFQTITQSGLTTIANAIMSATNNFAGHTTATFSDLIPLTSSATAGFMWGLTRR